MGLPFLRAMDIDPSGPSDRARRALFLSSSVTITPHNFFILFLFYFLFFLQTFILNSKHHFFISSPFVSLAYQANS